jgi:hypothetical protein
MKGYYVYKQDGIEIGRSENILTTAGKLVIANSMCANGTQWAGQIAVGTIGGTASGGVEATVSDKWLSFEFTRGNVQSLSALPYTSNPYAGGKVKLIAKAVLDAGVSGKIYETGLFSQDTTVDAFVDPIAMSLTTEQWTYRSAAAPDVWTDLNNASGAFTTGGRSGDDRIDFSNVPTVGSTKKIRFDTQLDMSPLGSYDNIAIACSTTAGTSATALIVKFYTDESNYFSYSVPVSVSYAGYRVLSSAKSSWTTTGTPTWSSIDFMEIENPGSLVTHLDAIRIIYQFADTESILISHSTLSEANSITKTEGTPLEIEYYLDVFS